MNELLRSLLQQALAELTKAHGWQLEQNPEINLTANKNSQHGDFASNLALLLAGSLQQRPRELAQQIVEHLPAHPQVRQVEIAGPGFINFFVAKDYLRANLELILTKQADYGRGAGGERVLLEFVSSNPTGPLHIGHGRGAVYGDSLARVLEFAGYEVYKEYYVNDAGRQVDILGLSVFLRWLQAQGAAFELPEGCYQGQYLQATAQDLAEFNWPDIASAQRVLQAHSPSMEVDAALDQMLAELRELLGADFTELKTRVVAAMINIMRAELEQLGVEYHNWFSELQLLNTGLLTELEEQLQRSGHIYSKEGATWLQSSAFGDEKDRVVRRANGASTYLASDIAYHHDKLHRPQRFQRLLNVWGSDHHGYIARLQAVISILQATEDQACELEIALVQMAYLQRGGERVSMSTRKATFYPLAELMNEIGRDALRFFYLLSGHNQDLELDVELALQRNRQNPVYYVQYAHARIAKLLERQPERPLERRVALGKKEIGQLTNLPPEQLQHELEVKVLECLHNFPALVQRAAHTRSPHLLTAYSRELASAFHSFYNKLPILNADPDSAQARLLLCRAVQIVLQNTANLLGISMPARM